MDSMLKEAVASLFCHIIKTGGGSMDEERALFCRFMQQNFRGTTCAELMELYEATCKKLYNVDTKISIIANALTQKTYEKMSIFKQAKHLVLKDNPRQKDYEILEKLKRALAL